MFLYCMFQDSPPRSRSPVALHNCPNNVCSCYSSARTSRRTGTLGMSHGPTKPSRSHWERKWNTRVDGGGTICLNGPLYRQQSLKMDSWNWLSRLSGCSSRQTVTKWPLPVAKRGDVDLGVAHVPTHPADPDGCQPSKIWYEAHILFRMSIIQPSHTLRQRPEHVCTSLNALGIPQLLG